MIEETEIARRRTAEEIVALRDTALSHYRAGLVHIERAQSLANRAADHAGVSFSIDSRAWFGGDIDEKMESIRKLVDRRVWQELKRETGIQSLMDAETSEAFDKELEKDVPIVCMDAVRATFARLMEEKDLIFERGVVNVFRKLCRQYKTNDAFRVGRKIIMTGGLQYNYRNQDQINDLDRVLHIIDGKPPKDHLSNAGAVLRAHRTYGAAQTEYMDFVLYMNGNVHITFRRPDLIDKVNLIIARALGGEDKLAERTAKRAKGAA